MSPRDAPGHDAHREHQAASRLPGSTKQGPDRRQPDCRSGHAVLRLNRAVPAPSTDTAPESAADRLSRLRSADWVVDDDAVDDWEPARRTEEPKRRVDVLT